MLERKYAFFWLILSIITSNLSILFLGKSFKVYNKNGWYMKWYYWVLGIVFGIVPALVMLTILTIQVNVKICEKLKVPGKEIYGVPYVWIGLLIIPVVGWTLFIILTLYIYVMYLIRLFQGKGEFTLNK